MSPRQSGCKTWIQPQRQYLTSIGRPVGAGLLDRPVPISSDSWVSRGRQLSDWDVGPSSPWSKGAQEYSKHHWSDYLGKASTTTCDGTVGGDLGQRYLSDMGRPFRSCLHGGDGAQSSRPTDMWLPGKMAPGVMSIYPDQLRWRGRSDSGNLSKELHAHPGHCGPCLSQRGANSMVGDQMVEMSMTGPMWKPWVPLTHRMGPREKRAQSGRGPNLRRRNRNWEPKRMDLGCLQPWDRSHHRPKGTLRRPSIPWGWTCRRRQQDRWPGGPQN